MGYRASEFALQLDDAILEVFGSYPRPAERWSGQGVRPSPELLAWCIALRTSESLKALHDWALENRPAMLATREAFRSGHQHGLL
jgi:hypothetical protein